jgi:hypothetical protein
MLAARWLPSLPASGVTTPRIDPLRGQSQRPCSEVGRRLSCRAVSATEKHLSAAAEVGVELAVTCGLSLGRENRNYVNALTRVDDRRMPGLERPLDLLRSQLADSARGGIHCEPDQSTESDIAPHPAADAVCQRRFKRLVAGHLYSDDVVFLSAELGDYGRHSVDRIVDHHRRGPVFLPRGRRSP